MASQGNSGFTLIEILVAILIAGITLLPTLDVLIKSYGLTNRQMDEGFALNLADSALNTIKTTRFTTLSDAFSSNQVVKMDIKFPGEAVSRTFDLPVGTEKPSFKGVKLNHQGSNADYFIKVELKRIAGEADGVSTIFNYGKCGYKGGIGASVSTFTAKYTTTEEIFTIWATVTCIQGKSERKFILSTCIADLGT